MPLTPTKVVFACVQNAGRSQMAAAFFNELCDPKRATAVSAGTRPARRPHPEVVATLHEIGIDISTAVPRLLNDELAASATWLITMGCDDQCPTINGVMRDDWPIADPKGQSKEQVRRIRDELQSRVANFLQVNGWTQTKSVIF